MVKVKPLELHYGIHVDKTQPEVFEQAFHHGSVTVREPKELADDIPIILSEPIVIHLHG